MKKIPVSSLQRKMFRMAFVTAAFTEFAQIFALTVDALIICKMMGENEIAAVGLASPFFYLVGVPAVCLGTGLQVVCSREMGRGRIARVNRIFSQCVLFTVGSMALLTAAVFLAVPLMARGFGARGSAEYLLPLTQDYLYGLAFEIVPFVLMTAMTSAVVLDNGSRTAMVSSVVGGVVNILLDIAAVRLHWGLFGIGLGSSLAALASLLTLLTHFLRKDRVLRFRLVRVRFREILEVLRLGGPASIHALAAMIRAMALNAMAISAGGGTAIAVLSINGTIMDFVEIPAAGIQGAVGILSGIGFGENNGEDLEATGALAHRYVCVVSAVIMAVLLLFTRTVAGFFLAHGSDGIPLLTFAIVCIALGCAFGELTGTRVSYLQATGNEKSARHLETLANLVLLLGLALVLSLAFGAWGLFAAFPLSKLLALVLVYVKYWLRAGKKVPGVRDFMALKPDCYHPQEDVITCAVDSLEKCVEVSEQVRRLCVSHGFGGRSTYYAGLCTEEIATNILQHGGYRRGGVRAEFRAVASDNALIIRVRDNGMAFNMNTLAKLLSEEESPFKNLGIRIICAAASEINYYIIYGMNTTVIRIQARPGSAADAA